MYNLFFATLLALFIVITINVQDVAGETSHKETKADIVEDCEHSFILKDDMGYVCRVCGVIEKSILDIIDVNFSKVSILFSDTMLVCALMEMYTSCCSAYFFGHVL